MDQFFVLLIRSTANRTFEDVDAIGGLCAGFAETTSDEAAATSTTLIDSERLTRGTPWCRARPLVGAFLVASLVLLLAQYA